MKKHLTAVLALTLASASLFAFDFNNAADINFTNDDDPKVEQKINNKMKAKEMASEKTISGVLLKGQYQSHELINNNYTSEKFPITAKFYVNNDKDIAYDLTYNINKVSDLEIFYQVREDFPGSADPEAPVTVYTMVNFKNKQGKQQLSIPVLSADKLDFMPAPSYDNTTYDHGANINADGRCNLCGDKVSDIYHHDISCQPKDNTNVVKPSVTTPTKVVEVYERQHTKDCKDQNHCECPGHNVKRTVNKEKVYVKIHNADCKDEYHCECPEKVEYR